MREVRGVVVVDDDAAMLDEYRTALQPRLTNGTTQAADAAALVGRARPDLVLVDLWLEGQAALPKGVVWGIDLMRQLRASFPDLLLVLLTGGYADAYRDTAIEAGASGALPKWLGPARVLAIIESGITIAEPPSEHRMSLARNSYEYLARVYVDNARNASRTARDLAIPRSTLYRKLREPTPPR